MPSKIVAIPYQAKILDKIDGNFQQAFKLK